VALKKIMNDLGIEIRHNCFVDEIQKDCICLTTGEEISFTHCLWATGAESHSLAFRLKDRGLAVSERGWIRVNKYLQSVSHPCVFAAGDCNVMEGLSTASPPKAGVYAVRAGPILIENLTKFLAQEKKESWKDYIPQEDFLKLLVCGDGTALGFRFGIPIHGKWVFQLKDAIDLTFMNLFKVENLPKLDEDKPYDTLQYDAAGYRRSPINPPEAAALLRRTDNEVDYKEAWDVLRDMNEDVNYQNSVLQLLSEYEETF
jgi:selenide,water dikinase